MSTDELLVACTIKIVRSGNFSVFLRQCPHRIANQLYLLITYQLCARRFPCPQCICTHLINWYGIHPPLTHGVSCAIAGDLREPAFEFGRILKLRQTSVSVDEGVLHHILGVMRIIHYANDNRKNVGVISPHQVYKRLLVARLYARNESIVLNHSYPVLPFILSRHRPPIFSSTFFIRVFRLSNSIGNLWKLCHELKIKKRRMGGTIRRISSMLDPRLLGTLTTGRYEQTTTPSTSPITEFFRCLSSWLGCLQNLRR